MSEKKVIEQHVIRGPMGTPEQLMELHAKFNRMLDQGWQPVGPVMCSGMPRFDYFQTWVKYDDE